ncbi:hypothetical protein [Botrimarina mediterranea]|uniref:hypothetical protein n=1 Tax=Botrimarina mediterranea TaxID=2528022 RepID=UPI0011A5E24D
MRQPVAERVDRLQVVVVGPRAELLLHRQLGDKRLGEVGVEFRQRLEARAVEHRPHARHRQPHMLLGVPLAFQGRLVLVGDRFAAVRAVVAEERL